MALVGCLHEVVVGVVEPRHELIFMAQHIDQLRSVVARRLQSGVAHHFIVATVAVDCEALQCPVVRELFVAAEVELEHVTATRNIGQ